MKKFIFILILFFVVSLISCSKQDEQKTSKQDVQKMESEESISDTTESEYQYEYEDTSGFEDDENDEE